MQTDKGLIEFLSGFTTENKIAIFDRNLSLRTRYCTVVLENMYQPHNASAVLRSCECFGIQDVHIIENNNGYEINPDIVLGSIQWLTLYRYNHKEDNTLDSIRALKAKGYRIIATTPTKRATELKNFDVGKGAFALFFGTEYTGLSDTVFSHADEFLSVPMYGFTESFNISVSAGIILYAIRQHLYNSGLSWGLSDEEKSRLKLQWLRNTIKKVDLLEKEYCNRRK